MLTETRKKVLDFIRAYTKIHGVSPTYEVIAKGMGLRSRSNAHRIVKRLESDGYLQVKPKKFYGIKVCDRSVKEIAAL